MADSRLIREEDVLEIVAIEIANLGMTPRQALYAWMQGVEAYKAVRAKIDSEVVADASFTLVKA